MDLADLTALIDFHYWARDRVLDAAAQLTSEQYTRDMGNSVASVRDTLMHLYDYKSFDQRPLTSPFGEMLHHVVNHGTYHRGQVTTMLRQLGAQPAKSVDLIVFYRERNAALSG